MTFSTFAEVIPANALASQIQEETEPAETEAAGTGRTSYEISMDDVTFSEDGSLILTLPETEATETEPAETEAAQTVPAETDPAEIIPEETEPEATEPEVTVPEETISEETEPEETIPEETESEETEPEETEPEETEPETVAEPLTWFQWIAELDVDTSALAKEEVDALHAEYAAYRINTLAQMGELPEGASSGSIANDYIEVSVGEDGRFTIGTRIGNPDYTSDNHKKLLYGHPSPWSSETLIYIDNGAYSNFFYADTISYSYDTATATMTIPSYNIKVVQTLKLVKSDNASFKDTVQIQYQVSNSDSQSHSVGVRIMMDTMLANNDHATFRVASQGNITTGKVYTGSSIPKLYQVYDNLDNPTTLATGCLFKDGDTKPDKVQFCNWGRIHGSGWNHYVNDGDYLGDSAVGIYFNPKTVKPGKSFKVRTYYGVSVDNSGSGSEEIQGDQVMITVKDNETKEPLSGVNVECLADGQIHGSGTTGEDGTVVLTGWNRRDLNSTTPVPMSIRLVMTMDGYKTSTVNCSMDSGSRYVYYLSKENAQKPAVNSVVLKTDTGEINLLNKTCKYLEDGDGLIEEKGATGTVTIQATSDMDNCTWLLVQDETVLMRNSNGKFVLNVRKTDDGTYIEKLTSGANLYVRAVSADGKESDKMRLGLKVSARTTKVEFFPLDLGEFFPEGGSAIAEGTLAAIFLGNKFEFGLNKSESLKFQVELVDGGKVRVGLNFTAKEWDDMNKKLDNGKTKKEMIDGLAKEMKDFAKEKRNNKMADITGKTTKYYYGNAKADLVICGYGEGTLENGSVRIDLSVFIALKGELKHTTQFLVGTIPCYIQVGGKAEAKLQASANLVNSEGVQFSFYNAEFTPSLGVWLEGGAGIKGAVSVGAKGEGTVSLVCNLVTNHQLAKLVASASIVAEVVFWEKEIPFVEKTIILYDSNDKDGTVYGGDENVYEMLDATPFHLVTREEMAGESADGGSSSSGAQVQLLNVGGTQYKFFIADRGGDQSNRFMLAYSKLVDGVWTDAVAVADDGTTDVYYDVATDGTNIYVIWSNSNKTFDDATVTLDEMFGAQEICFTTIGEDGTAAEPMTLTNDSAMDIMPAVTTVDGSVYAAWYHTANGIEYNTAVDNHYLYYTTITDGTVGELSTVDCENGAISSVQAATVNGLPMATYVTNASDEYSFQESVTHEIDMSNGTIQTVDTTDKTVGKSVTAEIDGEELVFWMENGNIAYAESMNAENPAYVFTDETIPGTIGMQNYTVMTVAGGTYLIWVESSEEGNAAMTSVYADGAWSHPYKLTSLASGNISNLEGYENTDGKLVLVYTAKNLSNNSEGGVDVSTATLEKTVETEQTLSISSIDFEITDAIPGENLPMTITVYNTGNTRIDSLDVNIDSNAGENFNSQLAGVNIEPGTAKTLQIIGFAPSSDLTTRTTTQGQYVYTVTVNATNVDDAAQSTFEIGYDNVLLYKQELALVDGRENIVIAVENASGFPATDVHVRVLADATDGVLIYDNSFEVIGANDRITIYLDVEDLNSSRLYASVTSDCTAAEETEYIEMILSNPVTTSTLTVDVYGCGTVSPAAPVEITIGEAASLSATANEGYLFDGWYSYKDLVWLEGDMDSQYAEIQMPSTDTTVTARFVSQLPYDFTLNAETAELMAAETFQLSAQFASPEETGKVIWSSSDETIATVNGRGLVTGVAEGTATITAACGDYVHTCQVTVSYADINAIRMIYPAVYLEHGEISALEVLTDPENCEGSLYWTSSDESIVTVDSKGNVTAVDYGSAVVTAVSYKDETVKAECVVNVIMPVTDILLDQHEMVMTLQNNQAELNIIYEPSNANYGMDIIWSVDDSSILSLAPSGDHNEKLTITALSCGEATITAQTESGYEATCSVSVRDIIHVSSVEEIQTAHNPYDANVDRTWVYTDETKEFLIVSFDEATNLYYNDVLQVLDADGNILESGSGSYFSGHKLLVDGSTVQIRLVSGSNTEGYYGFRVADITDEVAPEDIYIDTYTQEYTGKNLTPAFDVYLLSKLLTPGQDYTLSFSGNKNVGVATVKFKGKGAFAGVTAESTFTILPAYTELNATVISKGVKLTWAASKGAGGYYLYRSVNGGGYELYKTLSSSTKTFTDTDTNSDNYYTYYLVPFKKVKIGKENVVFEGYGDEYGPITKLNATKVTATTNQTDGCTVPYDVTLTWTPVDGADGYVVYYSENSSNFYRYTTTSQTQCSIRVRNTGRQQYKVVPYKYIRSYQREGAASNIVSAYGMYAPNMSTYATAKGISVHYSYGYMDGITGIELYRSTNGGKFTKFKTIRTTDGYTYGNVLDTGAKKSGAYYEYKARTFVIDGKVTYYSAFSNVNSAVFLSAPTLASVKPAENGLTLTWNKIAGADRYRIYRYYYSPNGDGSDNEFVYYAQNAKETKHTFTDTYATSVGVYNYVVVAECTRDGRTYSSAYGNDKQGFVLQTPSLRYLSNSLKGTEMSWNWVYYADGFEVWRSTDGGNKWTKAKTVTNSTYLNDTGASKNAQTYSYKIRAYVKQGGSTFYSDYSDVLSISKMTPPKLKKAAAMAGGGFEITFNAVSDAQYYQIGRYSSADDSYQPLDTIQQTSTKIKTYTFTDPTATEENTLYSYEITAHREKDNTHASATTWVDTYNFGKANVTLENVEKGIMIYAHVGNEYGVGYATSYTIYRSENGVKWTKLKTMNADNSGRLVYQDKTAKTGKTYSYKVEPTSKYLSASTTQQSDPVSLYCVLGPKLTKLTNAIDGITLTWTTQRGMPQAAGYRIYRSFDGYTFDFVGEVDAETFTFTDYGARTDYSGYIEDNFYSYKVALIPADETLPAACSNTLKTLRMEAPEYLEVSSSGSKTANLWWEYPSYANGFEIRYVTGNTTKIIKTTNHWGYYPLTGLKAGQEYEISIRAFFTYNRVKYYSDWSLPVTLYQ